MLDRVRSTVQLARAGAWSDIARVTRDYWGSESQTVGLRRDVSIPFSAPSAAFPIAVRPLKDADFSAIFESNGDQLSGDALRERSIRLRMARAKLGVCYVAANEADEPCYIQWLIGSGDNDRIRELFGDRFPRLAPDEMLLEGAFTLERWRGKGLMAAGMARIAEKALEHHASTVITFVATDNIPSLKGCKKAGFEPFVTRTDRWRLFKHRSSFGPLAATPLPV